eukprot:1158858-Pelagomonas_calceolata.AAC.1
MHLSRSSNHSMCSFITFSRASFASHPHAFTQPITLQPAVSRMSSLSSNESLFGSKGGPAPSQQPQLDHEGNSDSVPVPLDGAVPEGLNPNGVNKGAAQAEA